MKVLCANKNFEAILAREMEFNVYTGVKMFYKSLKESTMQCAGQLAALEMAWSRFNGLAAQSLDSMHRLAEIETAPIRMIIESIVSRQGQLLEIMSQAFDRYSDLCRALSGISSTIEAINTAINTAHKSRRAANRRGPPGTQSDAMQAHLDSNRQLVGMCARFDARRYVQWADLFHTIKHAQLILSTTSINAWSSDTVGISTEITPEIAAAQANLFSSLELPYNMKVDAILYQEACQEIGLMHQPHDAIESLAPQPIYAPSVTFQYHNAISPGDHQPQTIYNQNTHTYNPTLVPQSVHQNQHSQTIVQGPHT